MNFFSTTVVQLSPVYYINRIIINGMLYSIIKRKKIEKWKEKRELCTCNLVIISNCWRKGNFQNFILLNRWFRNYTYRWQLYKICHSKNILFHNFTDVLAIFFNSVIHLWVLITVTVYIKFLYSCYNKLYMVQTAKLSIIYICSVCCVSH